MSTKRNDLVEQHVHSVGRAPPEWNKSIILYALDCVTWLFAYLSPMAWVGQWFARKRHRAIPLAVVDAWLVLLFGLEGWCLVGISVPAVGLKKWLAVLLATFVLLDNAIAISRDAILGPRMHSGDFVVQNRRRWIAATALCAMQVVLAFAILFLVVDKSNFNSTISGPTTSVYYSLVTFTTLGYGDFYPATDLGRSLVILELVFVLLFLCLKLPAAVALLLVNTRESLALAVPQEGKAGMSKAPNLSSPSPQSPEHTPQS